MWWCNIRVYERMSIYVLYSIIYNSVCRYGIYSVYSMYRTVQCIMYVLYTIVYISVCQIMWWCMTEWNKAHLTHWQGNRAMTEPWTSIYIWFSASVPDHKAIWYLLLSVAISCYPVSVRYFCVCFLLSGA